MNRWIGRALIASALGLATAGAWAQSGQTVRIAFIDPLTGPMADIGRNSLRSWQFMGERFSGAANPAGVRFVVAPFDNKGSPHESLNVLKAAIDQGFRYVVQGNGSGVTHVLVDAIARHNARTPDAPVLLLNYAATDPALTGERCNYWHFRLDADTRMKVSALVDFMASQPALRKVYLINQDYAHGQQVSRHFREAAAQHLPDLAVVGDELHPPFQVRDFAGYARRIRDSGAQAVVTGNWGEDFVRLVQALQAAQVRLPLFTYYAALPGSPAALARSGVDMPVYQVALHHSRPEGELATLAADFRARYQQDFVVYASHTGIRLLGEAMAHARSTDTRRVADALEGLRVDTLAGPAVVRQADHQVLVGQFIARWQRVDDSHTTPAERTGFTFAPVRQVPAEALAPIIRCNFPRP